MLLSMLVFLATVLPAPTGYESAVARVPSRHWALVTSAHIDRDSGGQARRRTMSIHLTPYNATGRGDAQLWHEVGHIVYYAHPEIESDWRARFGKRRSKNEASELFADTYTEVVMTGCAERRTLERFLRERVFRSSEYPCRDAS